MKVKAKYKVVLGPSSDGRGSEEYDIVEDFDLSGAAVLLFKEHCEELRATLLKGEARHAYFVKDLQNGAVFIVDNGEAPFFGDLLYKFTGWPTGEYYLEVRRVDLVNGELYATEPYKKEFHQVANDWSREGLSALGP